MKKIKKVLIWISVVILIIVGIWVLMYTHRSKSTEIKSYTVTNPFITANMVQISAHRSGAGIAPEETMMAFKTCVETNNFSVDWIEFDLHITKDGELVLLHDDDLDRTSDSEEVFGQEDVEVNSKTLSELKQLNMGYKFQAEDGSYPYTDATGEVLDDLRIVTLDEALDFLTSKGDYNYIIEIKNDGDLGKQATDILHENIIERNLINKVIVGSFSNDVNDYMESYSDFSRCASPSEILGFIKACFLNDSNYTPSFEVISVPFNDIKESYGFNMGTADFINYAHAHNVAAFYWTINDTDDMEYLTSIYADCLITDYPDKAAAFQVER